MFSAARCSTWIQLRRCLGRAVQRCARDAASSHQARWSHNASALPRPEAGRFTYLRQTGSFHGDLQKAVVSCTDIGCAGMKALLNAGLRISRRLPHPAMTHGKNTFPRSARLSAPGATLSARPGREPSLLMGSNPPTLRPDFLSFSFYYRAACSGARTLATAPHAGAYNHDSALPRYRGR